MIYNYVAQEIRENSVERSPTLTCILKKAQHLNLPDKQQRVSELARLLGLFKTAVVGMHFPLALKLRCYLCSTIPLRSHLPLTTVTYKLLKSNEKNWNVK